MSNAELSKPYLESAYTKVYVQYRPVPPTELINRVLEFLQEKYNGPLELCLDLGCGSGQCTFKLVDHFTSVLGTDMSPAQVAEATESCAKLNYKNVKFQVSPGEVIPAPDKSVQLITICEAAHWMDLPKVYEEAKRVLTPNGVLALIGYMLPVYIPRPKEDEGKSDAIKKVVDKVIEETLEFWPKAALSVLTEYSDITIPFSDFTRQSGFKCTRKGGLADIIGCIRSYAPFKSFCLEKGDNVGTRLLDQTKNGIIAILNEGRETPLTPEQAEGYEFTETFNYFLLMARI